jgi:hypothetical protein
MAFHNKIFIVVTWILAACILLSTEACHKKLYTDKKLTQDALLLGVYYFDGWTGKTHHVSTALRDNFPERKPVWGWVTSTPEAIKDQIDLAADAGISFFNFCWYYSKTEDPLNQALGLYLKAPNKERLQFSLLVANHQGYIIGPAEWNEAARAWIRLFKEPGYVQVQGKPYISFFSVGTLVQSFGSAKAVKLALDQLRSMAAQEGLKGVTIAACVSSRASDIEEAKACGFDVLTSYNDHAAGFKQQFSEVPIQRLISANVRIWNAFKGAPLPYVPTVTLNWDFSAWTPVSPASPHYTGYSENSVYASVRSVRKWIKANSSTMPGQPVAMLYAWNEYGEGAWLTPSMVLKDSLLGGLKKALRE